jgi:hypothetical protein
VAAAIEKLQRTVTQVIIAGIFEDLFTIAGALEGNLR